MRDLRVSLSEELAAVVSVAMPDKNPTVKEVLGEWYRKGEFSMAPCLSVWPCKVHGYGDIYAMNLSFLWMEKV